MVAYNFHRRFASDIRLGKKRQTIRRERKRGNAYVGCALRLYVGMRTKNCEKLIDARCVGVKKIWIDCANGCTYLENQRLTRKQEDEFAKADGFENALELYDFLKSQYEFTDFYPLFEGTLIEWEPNTCPSCGSPERVTASDLDCTITKCKSCGAWLEERGPG